jgi:hypothetical protein
MLISMQMIAQHNEIKTTQEGILAKNMEKKGADTKSYAAAKEEMDADVAFFDTLTADCKKRSDFYAGQVSDAHAEDDAIDAALPILEGIISGDNAVGSFVQLTSKSHMSLESRVDATSRVIAKLTTKSKSGLMSSMSEASSVSKLIQTCKDMIATLKTEIGEVEQSKETCLSETHRLETEKLEAEADK